MSHDVRELAGLFDDALEADERIRNPAEHAIIQMFVTSAPALLVKCAEIILSPAQISTRAWQYCFVLFNRAFCPTAQNSLPVIQRSWRDVVPDSDREKIKMAAVRGLMFPDEKIWQPAAIAVSQIVSTDPILSFDLLENLVTLLVSAEYSPSTRFAAISAIREIYKSGAISLIDPDTVFPILKSHLEYFYVTLANAHAFVPSFIREIFLTLAELVRIQPTRFAPAQEQSVIFGFCRNILPHVLDLTLFESIHILFDGMVQSFYGSSTFDIEQILQLTGFGINSNRPDFVSISLAFWRTEIACEIELMHQNETIQNYNNARESHLTNRQRAEGSKCSVLPECCYQRTILANYWQLFASRFLNVVFDVMFRIDATQTGVETQDDKVEPHMFAFSVIRKIFFLEPLLVLEHCRRIFSQFDASEITWVRRHGMLLVLGCICSRQRILPEIRELLEEQGCFVIESTVSDVDRVSETALYVLDLAIECYGLYVTPNTLTELIHHVETLINRDTGIAGRSIDVLTRIIERFGRLMEDSPLPGIWPYIEDVYTRVTSQDDIWLIEKVCHLLEQYVCRLPNNFFDSVKQMTESLVSNLQASSLYFAVEDRGRILALRQGFLSILGGIFKTYGIRLDVQAHSASKALLGFVLSSSEKAMEEVLRALIHIVTALADDTKSVLDELWPAIERSISSQDPSLITTTVMLVSNLYRQVPELVISRLRPVVGLITTCLDTAQFTRDFYPNLMRALSYILTSVAETTVVIPPARDHIFHLFQRLVSLPLDLSKEEDVEFGNRIYEVIFMGYASVIYSGKDDVSFLMESRVAFFAPVQGYLRLAGRFSDESLKAFLDFMSICRSYLPQRCGVLLNNKKNYAVLLWAQASRNKEIAKDAEDLFRALGIGDYKKFVERNRELADSVSCE
jgi:hypothetical protein